MDGYNLTLHLNNLDNPNHGQTVKAQSALGVVTAGPGKINLSVFSNLALELNASLVTVLLSGDPSSESPP